MNSIAPFTFPTTGQEVRTILIESEPWFVAADVTAILGYVNGRDALRKHVDDEDRLDYRRSEAVADRYPFDDLRIQSVTMINESGLYSLILRSEILGAREFKRWVTREVLPTVRRTGSYGMPQDRVEVSRKELARMVIEAEDARELAEMRAGDAEAKMVELAPSARAWDTLATAHGDYDVARAAQILSRDPAIKTGRDRLFTHMNRFGWVYRAQENNRWRAYQTQIDLSRLMILPSSHYHPRTGELVLDVPQIRITVKGLRELHRKLGGTAPIHTDETEGAYSA